MSKRIRPGQHVIVSLRRMIASGELKEGERVTEIPTAQALGVSRMPVRAALKALEEEGLVVKMANRGYAVKGLSREAISSAIEVRGVLEGLAARRLARRGLTSEEEASFRQCLERGEAVFPRGHLENEDLDRYHTYNVDFHALMVKLSGNEAIEIALARNNLLPFASAAALALDIEDRVAEYNHLAHAHQEHIAAFEAILAGDEDKAAMVMEGHAKAVMGSASIFQAEASAIPAMA